MNATKRRENDVFTFQVADRLRPLLAGRSNKGLWWPGGNRERGEVGKVGGLGFVQA